MVPRVIGEALFFLSNVGPYLILKGGQMRPFSEFKIKELWPDKSDELYGDLESYETYIRANTSAVFWQNNIRVFYKNFAGVSRIWNYYFNPDLVVKDDAPSGPWEMVYGVSE